MSNQIYRKGNTGWKRGILEELLLTEYGELGRIPIPDAAGFELLSVTDVAQPLQSIPATAGAATIQIQSDGTETDPNVVVRYKNAISPAADNGFILGNLDIMEISSDSLATIEFISTEGGKSHKIAVQYWESIEQDK